MEHREIPTLVAHRGHAECFPENSKSAFMDALDAGAQAIEFDIQLSKDLQPLVLHDPSLDRTSNLTGSVFDYSLTELQGCSIHEPARFEDKYYSEPLLSLVELSELFSQYPDCQLFAEIKPESIEKFGLPLVVDRTLRALEKVAPHTVIISMDDKAIEYAQACGAGSCGWVMHQWRTDGEAIMRKLKANFLFCDYLSLPITPHALWKGSWQWALYEVTDVKMALQLFKQGSTYIETKRMRHFMNQPPFLKLNQPE
jgi:glycerophosphoryl diester phosphodiesterase